MPQFNARTCATVALALLAACSDAPSPQGASPAAQLALPLTAVVGELVSFDASASSDPGGSLLTYRFNGGDGSPEVETGAPVFHHVYRGAHRFVVCVQVANVRRLWDRRCKGLRVRLAAPDAGPPDGGIPDLFGDGPPTDAGPDQALDASADGAAPDQGPDGPGGDFSLDQSIDTVGDAPTGDTGGDAAPEADLMDLGVDSTAADQGSDTPLADLASDLAAPDQGTQCLATEPGGSGAGGYAMQTVPACLLDISSIASPLGLNSGEQGLLTFLPFNFTFYGQSQFAAGISSNGYLQFPGGSKLALTEPVPPAMPAIAAPNNVVAALWDDLEPHPDGGTDVMLATIGAAPSRVYIIQWNSWTFAGLGAAARVTFAIYLYETSNVLELHYYVLDGGGRATGAQAAVGIENATGTQGAAYLFQQAGGLSIGKAVRFVPQ